MTENKSQESVVCKTCGATPDTYAAVCDAPLEVPCRGFVMFEEARRASERVSS